MAIAAENVSVSVTNGFGAYSNSGAGRIVVALIALCSSAACSVSAVTGGGLTWVQRSTKSQTDGSGAVTTQEVWWAYAASQLSSANISFTDNSLNTRTLILFSVTGVFDTANPWDTNAGLPFEAGNIGAGSSPSVGGIAWDANDVLVITHQTTRAASFTQASPSGYTDMGPVNNEPVSGSNRTYTVGGYKVQPTALSGQTLTGSPSETPWMFSVDVLAGGAPPPPVIRGFGTVIN